jgi:hypothetical protein
MSTGLREPSFADLGKADARGVETIGGYRIIRKLGSGERSDVYLGHAAPTAGAEAELAAIKLFRAGVPEASIDGEINALSRLRNPHIVGLLDLATGLNDRPCLVLQRLDAGGLPALLAGRRMLQLGEAVTILAPVVAAVAAMHREGVGHGGIGARSILFDGSGAPVVAGFGAAACFAPSGAELSQAVLDSEALVLGDRSALLKLVTSVVGRAAIEDDSAAEFSKWLARQDDAMDSLAELEQRIFALAEPLSVKFSDSLATLDSLTDGVHPVPSRLMVTGGLAEQRWQTPLEADQSQAAPSLRAGTAADLLSVLPPVLADWISERLAVAPAWLESRAAVLRAQLRSVRKSVWVVAAVGLTAVIGAVVVAEVPAKSGEPVPVSQAVALAPDVSVAIAGDDPIAAVQELLSLRARCLHDRSILCLDSVHAADSAAWQADAERIRSVEDGAELSPDAFTPGNAASLVDRLGQTALVELATDAAGLTHTTASVLMIRTVAGWRFRSLVAGSAPVDGALP